MSDDYELHKIRRLLEIMQPGGEKWKDLAGCQVEKAEDVSFITKPDEVTEKRWAKICSKCPVIRECFLFHEETDATGVYAAGEWRV